MDSNNQDLNAGAILSGGEPQSVGNLFGDGMSPSGRPIVFWGLMLVLLPNALIFTGMVLTSLSKAWKDSLAGKHEDWVFVIGTAAFALFFWVAVVKVVRGRMRRPRNRNIQVLSNTQE